jgi:acetylornithine/succinyldiaminopimelate/putrescine aminotransferase
MIHMDGFRRTNRPGLRSAIPRLAVLGTLKPGQHGSTFGGILAKDTHGHTHGHTIRIAPPLVITAEQVDWALENIEAALRQEVA